MKNASEPSCWRREYDGARGEVSSRRKRQVRPGQGHRGAGQDRGGRGAGHRRRGREGRDGERRGPSSG